MAINTFLDRFKITNEIPKQIKINSENIEGRRSSCEEKISGALEWKERLHL